MVARELLCCCQGCQSVLLCCYKITREFFVVSNVLLCCCQGVLSVFSVMLYSFQDVLRGFQGITMLLICSECFLVDKLLLRCSECFFVCCCTVGRVFSVVARAWQTPVTSNIQAPNTQKYSFSPWNLPIEEAGIMTETWIWYNSGLRHFLIPFSPLLLIISCPLSTVPSKKKAKLLSIRF